MGLERRSDCLDGILPNVLKVFVSGQKDFVLIFSEKYLRFQETCLSNIGKLSFKVFLLPFPQYRDQ